MRAVRPREGREERRPSPGRSSFPETEFVQNDSLSFHETVCYNFTEYYKSYYSRQGDCSMPRAPVCPFYGRVKREQLVCLRDGADTTGQGELSLSFPDQMGRVRYWVQHCCKDWHSCSLAAALWMETNSSEMIIGQAAEICCGGSGSLPYTPPKSAAWRTKQGLAKLESWAQSGLTSVQIAEKCGCSPRTLRKWVRRYPDIAQSLRAGGLEPFRNAKSAKFRTPEGLQRLAGWSRKGLCDAAIARKCHADPKTFWKWRHKYPEITQALERGRQQ